MACEQTVSQILVSITTVDRRRLVDARRGQPTISQPPWSLLEAEDQGGFLPWFLRATDMGENGLALGGQRPPLMPNDLPLMTPRKT